MGGWILLRLYFSRILGVGWAGTYPGFKAFGDIIEGPQQSRAVVIRTRRGEWCGFVFGCGDDRRLVWLALGYRARRRRGGDAFVIVFRTPEAPSRPHKARSWISGPFYNSALAYSIGYLVHTWGNVDLAELGRNILDICGALQRRWERYRHAGGGCHVSRVGRNRDKCRR